jgi:hypothetical protein
MSRKKRESERQVRRDAYKGDYNRRISPATSNVDDAIAKMHKILQRYCPDATLTFAEATCAALLAGTIIVQPDVRDNGKVLVLATDDGDRLLIRHCDSLPAAQDMLNQLYKKFPRRKTLLLTEEGDPRATEDVKDLFPFLTQSS